ncbi:hypothetical protein ILYODFUR_010681 [Ilyodon furcidens]|uniref:Uncharacterized protein n=1 Tax=Ilyodon furcidens TaxID=33524 RepID=A0ABV0T814_9TELE
MLRARCQESAETKPETMKMEGEDANLEEPWRSACEDVIRPEPRGQQDVFCKNPGFLQLLSQPKSSHSSPPDKMLDKSGLIL